MRTRTLTPLKLTILEAGFTQREISRRSGIDESVLSLITNGRYLPDELQRAKNRRGIRPNRSGVV